MVFLNPPLTLAQADAVRAAGGPVFGGADAGVYCSTRRTLTLVARDGATPTAFATTLHALADRVERQTGIRLHPEPVTVGHHPSAQQDRRRSAA